ncbi:uncharacterized protein PAC_10152 [Phialocephala subalpina]|uniref:PEBP-like protein n=1 Tax=Phialocephala subalpina TaxID=576137 RepID=A0A1L7X5F6_9HELO|nr:uncharacterized protein PAC_10152 [Phialocephala subalpina]
MLSSTFIAVALAGAAIAFTPSGFQPASTQNMTVAFGNTLAINGKEMQKADTATAPTLGTSQRLFGTYTVMMVDPDIPPATAGGATSELLHWMQSGLVSANTSTTIGGVATFELINPGNTSAIASYIQPSPPNKAPNTHRYTQLLLNTTAMGSNTTALNTLMTAGKTRTNFSAVNVVKAAGVAIIAGNSFDVTNGTLVQSNITKTTSVAGSGAASATGTGSGTRASDAANASSVTTGAPKATGGVGETFHSGNGALIAGLGALAAAVAML